MLDLHLFELKCSIVCAESMVKDMDNQAISSGFAQSGGVSYSRASATGAAAPAAQNSVAPEASVSVQGLGGAYVTPKGTVDAKSGVYVLQLRNSDTGEVKNQYPSKKVVEAYKSAPVVEQSQSSAVASSDVASSVAAPAPAASTSSSVAVTSIGHNSDTLA